MPKNLGDFNYNLSRPHVGHTPESPNHAHGIASKAVLNKIKSPAPKALSKNTRISAESSNKSNKRLTQLFQRIVA